MVIISGAPVSMILLYLLWEQNGKSVCGSNFIFFINMTWSESYPGDS